MHDVQTCGGSSKFDLKWIIIINIMSFLFLSFLFWILNFHLLCFRIQPKCDTSVNGILFTTFRFKGSLREPMIFILALVPQNSQKKAMHGELLRVYPWPPPPLKNWFLRWMFNVISHEGVSESQCFRALGPSDPPNTSNLTSHIILYL